jgi:hypothetical protein
VRFGTFRSFKTGGQTRNNRQQGNKLGAVAIVSVREIAAERLGVGNMIVIVVVESDGAGTAGARRTLRTEVIAGRDGERRHQAKQQGSY